MGGLAETRLRQLASLAGERDLGPQHQSQVVLTVASIAESYVDGALTALIAVSGYDTSAFGRALFAALEDRIYQSWSERHDWLQRGFSVSVAGTAATQDLLTLAELRNAIVHGGGRLTERQSRELGPLIALEERLQKSLQVRTENRYVYLTKETRLRAIKAAREYILQLDAEIRRQHPSVRV